MATLLFSALKDGSTITDSGLIKIGYYGSFVYSSVLTINPLKLVERIHNENLSNYTASLSFFINRNLNGGNATLHIYNGSTKLFSKNITSLDFVSADFTTYINQELQRYISTGQTNNLVLTINLSVQGITGTSLEDTANSYIEIVSMNNTDTFKRPHLGIEPQADIDYNKNFTFPLSTPYIGNTTINPNISRIRHEFSLFTIEANSLSFNLSLIYDSYFKNNPNLRPSRFNFGNGYNLNIDEYIVKSPDYSTTNLFGDKTITLYDSSNNKITFIQTWYYINNGISIPIDIENYPTRIFSGIIFVTVDNVEYQAYYQVKNLEGTLSYYPKYYGQDLNEIYDKIIDLNGTKYYFNDDGLLIKIEDIHSNRIEISNNSIISSIMVGNTRTQVENITFNTGNYINSISLSILNSTYSNSISFTYNAVNSLTKITRTIENGEIVHTNITYGSYGSLSSISSSIPYTLSFSYTNDYKISKLNLSSTIDTISQSITTTTSSNLLTYDFYDQGDIYLIKDSINNKVQKYILDYNSILLKEESKDYDLLEEEHTFKESNSDNLPLSLVSFNNKSSNLVKSFTLSNLSFSEYCQIVTFGSTYSYRKREGFIAVLDLSDVNDYYLLNNDIELTVTTYVEFGMPSKVYKTKYNNLYNSKIGVLFFYEKESEVHFELKIKSFETINYGSASTINVYRCDGLRNEYDGFNRIIREDSNDEKIVYSYGDNSIIPTSSATFDMFSNSSSLSYSKDPNTNQLLSTTDSNGFVKTNSYDSNNLITSEILYHSSDQNLKSIKRYGSENSKTYEISDLKNDNNQFVEAKNTYYYNTNTITKEKLFNGYNITHGLDQTTLNTVYKSLGVSQSDEVRYNYNHSLITGVSSYESSNTFEYWYDNKFRKKRVILPNFTAITKEYTDNFNYPTLNIVNGQKIKTNYPNNYSETGYFDKEGKIKKIERTSTNYINFTYNSKDLLSNLFAYHTMESFNYSYDNYDRLTNLTRTTNGQYPLSQSNTYVNDKLTNISYNINGINSSESYSYHTTLGYNKDLVYCIATNNFDTYISYDKLRRPTNKTIRSNTDMYNYFVHTFSYKNVSIPNVGTNSLPLVSSESLGIYNNTLYTLIYDYDVMGNVKSIRKNSTLLHEYEYDALNRLKIERNNTVPTQNVYAYDARGNITQKKIQAILSNGNTIDLQTKNYSYSNQYWYDLLTSDGTYNYTYDSLGRMTSYKNNTLTWNNDSTLSSFGSNVSYTYDALKIRKTKTVNNVKTTYYYIGDKLLRESSPNKDLLFYYNGDNVIGFRYNNNDYIYHKNMFGDVLEIYTMEDGLTKVAEYSYDAFGNTSTTNLNSDNIGTINPFRYRSYYYDSETELYYLITRYYSPYLMRFISPDSFTYITDNIGDINVCNLFVYCNNNPVMYVDPDGEVAVLLTALIGMAIGFGIGAAISGSFEIGKQIYNNGWNPIKWNWGQIGLSALGGGVAGAISAIPIPGTGFLSYLGTFAIGGVASVAGGIISGSVNSWQTALLAFGIGGVANVVGRGLSDLAKHFKINRQIETIKLKANKIASMNAKNKSLSIWNLIGPDNYSRNAFKSWNATDIFNLLVSEANTQLSISGIDKMIRYTVYSSIISSLGSGWL